MIEGLGVGVAIRRASRRLIKPAPDLIIILTGPARNFNLTSRFQKPTSQMVARHITVGNAGNERARSIASAIIGW